MAKKKHKRDPEDWKIKRQRKGNVHITNCATGYRVPLMSQIHHVVCVTCMQDGTIGKNVPTDQMEFIRKCLAMTEWDINAEPNDLGLPLKPAYYLRPNDGWDGLPCHQVDHPQYTEDVSKYLNDNIWQPLIEARDWCSFDAATVIDELNGASDHYRAFLNERGQQRNGTRACWRNRFNYEKWYIPFSMDPGTPRARKAPPDVISAFKGLFSLVK
ncbi:MAG: hypothetical protein IT429_10925 [Gemmataceae bacterium]|nr:hypothetical protein [Gemmataceae bacterium]